MATGIIRNFLIPPPPPPAAYLPLIFQQCPYSQDRDRAQEEEEEEEEEEGDTSEVRGAEDYEEEEEDEEEEEEDEEEEEVLAPVPHALDVTKQLLRFADLISRDVRRYFGRSSGEEEARDIYGDPVSVTTGGRLRYYDDLLKIARAGSPEEPENPTPCGEGPGGSGLGPLAELFQLGGPGRSPNRPMIKRHLPLSFWSEPSPHGCTGDSGRALPPQGADCLDSGQPDFSDLLAFWEPNPELTHTLTDNTHTQQRTPMMD